MSTRTRFSLTLATLLLLAGIAGCGAAAPTPAQVTVAVEGKPVVVKETVPAMVVEPTAEPGAPSGLEAPEYVPPVSTNRMIIKNAELELLVENTDVAIDRITGIATQFSGYLVSSQTWVDDGYKEASMVIGVPVDTFENALRRIREIATEVTRESASGEDVTDQYTDLQSQLRNLEATETRLRTFLDKATTVEEALQVNEELSKITERIEVIKGKLQYIEGRASYSTITIYIRPPRPPKPTPTPTPTPTPVAWRPSETLGEASGALNSTLQFAWDALIWIGVFLLPTLGIPALVIFGSVWAVRRARKRNGDTAGETGGK